METESTYIKTRLNRGKKLHMLSDIPVLVVGYPNRSSTSS